MKKYLFILYLSVSHQLINAQEKPSNFTEQLNLGEMIYITSTNSEKKNTNPFVNNLFSMETFLKKNQNDLIEKNKKNSEKKPIPKSLTNTKNEPNIELQKTSFPEFQKCALNTLPIIKHLLGKLMISPSSADIDDDYSDLPDLSKSKFTKLKLGQLICGKFLCNKIFSIFIDGEPTQLLSDQAIFLSIVTRINDPHSFSTAWIITAFTQGFNKDATNNDFWKSYWKYLSLEILIKNNFYFMSPDEFSLKILNKEWDKAKKQQLEETHTALKEI